MKSDLIKKLHSHINQDKAEVFPRFFKSGKGEYGEGDLFLGISVPDCRMVVKEYWKDISMDETIELLHSRFHEERLTALLILVKKFEKGDPVGKERIYDLYLKSITKYINNWDLVDLTAPRIVGDFLKDKDRTTLYSIAKSENLWERRVSILATFQFIYNKETTDTYKIAELLLRDKHDLIHKATGWMLREAGKRVSEAELLQFLDKYCKEMPRTMLRYSIERLSPALKLKYMTK